MRYLQDTRECEWIESKEYQPDAAYGICKGIVTIKPKLDINPILLSRQGEVDISPTGTWETYIMKPEIDLIKHIEAMGKHVTVLAGDSKIPSSFIHFPGASDIVEKKFFEIDLSEYDLCMFLDAATPEQISRIKTPLFPLSLRSVVIDHHETNQGYGDVNLILSDYPATGQVVFELFVEWGIEITPKIADCLFVAIYFDTLGFQTPLTSVKTFEAAASLKRISSNTSELISRTQNTNTPGFIAFQALALSSIKSFCDGKLAIACISADDIRTKNIPFEEIKAGMISPIMRTVAEWKIVAAIIEVEPKKLRMSFRSKDMIEYDVTKLAQLFGGGGHKEAAGATSELGLDDAIKLIVSKARELYNL
jgi:phosphoesterase RecJ-like protein